VPNLLHIDSSADLAGSTSRNLTARFAQAWSLLSHDHSITRRDLHLDPPPHLPTNVLHWAAHLRTAQETVPVNADQLQQQLIGELLNADVVLIGAPMYNWSLPSTLKAWIDYIHVPGQTAPYDTPTQPLAGKPVIVVSSRGDQYGPETPNASADHEIPALRQVLGVALGMDVHVVVAELTLAARVPALAALAAQATASLESAAGTLDQLVVRFGGPAH